MKAEFALLLAVSVFLTVIYGIWRNIISKKNIKTNADFYLFSAVSSLLSAATLVVSTGGIKAVSAYTALLGLVFGVATALAAILFMKALAIGPMSYSSLIVYSAMIIPALSGRIFWNEAVSALQYSGMALMLFSFALSVEKDGGNKKAGKKWILCCLGSFICTGSIGVMQKIHQLSPHGGESGMFLIIAFITAAVFSLGAFLACVKAKGDKRTLSLSPVSKVMLLTAGCGISIALINQINLYLSGAMSSAIFFPVVNGGSIFMTVLAGIILFREKLTRRQWAGMAAGMAAVALICLG